jgi:hypothetical protein
MVQLVDCNMDGVYSITLAEVFAIAAHTIRYAVRHPEYLCSAARTVAPSSTKASLFRIRDYDGF